MAEYFSKVGGFEKVDPRLLAILEEAANRAGRRVEAYSGYRKGDKGQHGSGAATDIRLFDPEGKMIPNYQDAGGFGDYEALAKIARQVQMDKYPELAEKFRWGGYFGPDQKTGKPTYGTMDTMHFDLGGGGGRGMLGGSWQGGLSDQMFKLFPGLRSAGTTLNSVPKAPVKPGPGGLITEATTPFNPASAPAASPGIDMAALGKAIGGARMLSSGLQGTPVAAPEAPAMAPIGGDVMAGIAGRQAAAQGMMQQLLASRRRPRGLTLGGY